MNLLRAFPLGGLPINSCKRRLHESSKRQRFGAETGDSLETHLVQFVNRIRYIFSNYGYEMETYPVQFVNRSRYIFANYGYEMETSPVQFVNRIRSIRLRKGNVSGAV